MEVLLLGALFLGLPFLFGGFDDDDSDDISDTDTGDETDPDEGGTSSDTIFGSQYSDLIEGTRGDDSIRGLAGFDEIFGDAGNDSLYGDLEDDAVYGGDGNDFLSGGLGWDDLIGDNGNDTLDGGFGDDVLDGGNGDDLLSGGGGADYLYDGAGTDTLLGGDGDDLLYDIGDPFTANDTPSVMDGGAGDDSLFFSSGSTITGGTGADALWMETTVGDAAVELLDFNPAEDTLEITLNVIQEDGGELSLVDWDSGDGADLYYDGVLVAQITGGQDINTDDIAIVQSLPADGAVNAFDDSSASNTTFGNNFDNTIAGGDGDDAIYTGPRYAGDTGSQGGENLVLGEGGNDTLVGEGGEIVFSYDDEFNETVSAVIEADTLNGGEGDDLLVSVNGNEMSGGAGADVFAIEHDIPAVADGLEFEPSTITDFNAAEDELAVIINPNTYHNLYSGNAEVTVDPWDDGLGADVLIDGAVIAEVTGGQGLTAADIRIEQFRSEMVAGV